jgi:hypothetical protein
MACTRWTDEWVAQLYDELDPVAARECSAHLAACDDCRRTMDGLAATRRILHEEPLPAALPAPAPRVLVLRPRRAWTVPWALAAGAACALTAFGVGLWSAPRLGPAPAGTHPPAVEATVDALSREVERLRRSQSDFEARVASLEASPASGGEVVPAARLTREQLASELERVEARLAEERERDLEAVLHSLTAAERRTGTWMDETRQALQVLALRQDPRFRER